MLKKFVCMLVFMSIIFTTFSNIKISASDVKDNTLNVKSSAYIVTYNNSAYDSKNTISDIPPGTSINTFLYNLRNDNPNYLINIFKYNNNVPELYEKISQIGNRRMYVIVRANAADTGEKFILIPQIKTTLNSDFEKYEKGIFQNDDTWNFTKSSQNVGDANIIEEENNRVCRISFSKTADSYPSLETGLLKLPNGSRAELTFKLRNNKNNVYVRLRDSNSSSADHYLEPIYRFVKTIRCFSSKNYITNSNGENLSIENGTWVKFRIILDRTNSDDSKNSISVFLNDEKAASKTAKFSNYSQFNWNEFKVQFGASPSNEFENLSQCDIDDFSYRVLSEESEKSFIEDYNTYSTDKTTGFEYAGAVISGSNKIKVKVKNPVFPLTLYAAEKSGNELIRVSVCNLDKGKGDSEYLTAELNVTDAVKNLIELYVWEDNTLKPLDTVIKPEISKISKAISNGHPRVLADENTFSKILKSNHHKHVEWKNTVLINADEICDLYTNINSSSDFYVGRFVSFSDSSNRVKKFGSILGMAYQLTKNQKYSDKFYEIAMDASNHTGWTDGSWDNLTTAYMTEGLSLGFDWCYDGLSDLQKQAIADFAIEKCLSFALEEYYNESRNSHTWSVTYTNHNAIPNSSFIIGSIAFADFSPQLCQTVLDNSCERLKIFLAGLYPDGGWWEGASYTNLVYAHLAKASETLKLNFGIDDVIANSSFIKNSPEFFIGIIGPTGSYNFAEQKSPQLTTIPEMLWLANLSKRNDVRSWTLSRINFDNASNCVLSLIWADNPDNVSDYEFKNTYIRGMEHITLGNGNKDNASWLSVLGGTNYGAHKHLDLGSFVYDYNGVRWANELGYDNYYKGYHAETSAEKIFYRTRTEGHNTLEINPSSASGGQRMNDTNGISKAEVIKYDLRSDKPYAIYDMSTAYFDNASSVKRGFRLLDDNIGFVVRDEFTCLSDGNIVNWYMHTDASIELSDDGKSALLTQDGKSVKLYVIEENLSFSVADAITPESILSELLKISESKNLELHKQNWNGYKDGDSDTSNDMKKLKITHSGKASGTITVVLLPISKTVPNNANISLDSWN